MSDASAKGASSYYILAIDPSLNNTGYAVALVSPYRTTTRVEIIEVSHIPNKQFSPSQFGHKLKHIERRLYQLRDVYKPSYVCKEDLATTGYRQAEYLAPVHGIAHMVFGSHCDIKGYSPTKIKKDVTGDGKADKDDIAQAIQLYLLGKVIHTELDLRTFHTDDESDSIAILITYLLDKQIISKLDKR